MLHFCSLTYSRVGGQTCDDYIDLEKLTFEPEFQKYVRDSFAPVGLMIDYWADEPNGGEERQIPVVVINDLAQDWSGQVRFRLLKDGKTLQEKTENADVPALGEKSVTFACTIPAETGSYQLEAPCSVSEFLRQNEIPETEVAIIILNERRALPESLLSDGDLLRLFPLIGGG